MTPISGGGAVCLTTSVRVALMLLNGSSAFESVGAEGQQHRFSMALVFTSNSCCHLLKGESEALDFN